jgi:hypothetical protein
VGARRGCQVAARPNLRIEERELEAGGRTNRDADGGSRDSVEFGIVYAVKDYVLSPEARRRA